MAGDVAKLYGSVAKLTQLSAAPPKPKLFSGVSVEEMAMDIVVKRKQAQAWFYEVQNAFIAQYGLRGWEEVQREIVHIQKQQKAAQLAAQKEHEEQMHQLKTLGMAALVVVMLVIGMIVTISLSIK
jgi:heme/copper-type cytochrome/quinol oxidase subunit 2